MAIDHTDPPPARGGLLPRLTGSTAPGTSYAAFIASIAGLIVGGLVVLGSLARADARPVAPSATPGALASTASEAPGGGRTPPVGVHR
jgi:hypothetical protein